MLRHGGYLDGKIIVAMRSRISHENNTTISKKQCSFTPQTTTQIVQNTRMRLQMYRVVPQRGIEPTLLPSKVSTHQKDRDMLDVDLAHQWVWNIRSGNTYPTDHHVRKHVYADHADPAHQSRRNLQRR